MNYLEVVLDRSLFCKINWKLYYTTFDSNIIFSDRLDNLIVNLFPVCNAIPVLIYVTINTNSHKCKNPRAAWLFAWFHDLTLMHNTALQKKNWNTQLMIMIIFYVRFLPSRLDFAAHEVTIFRNNRKSNNNFPETVLNSHTFNF